LKCCISIVGRVAFDWTRFCFLFCGWRVRVPRRRVTVTTTTDTPHPSHANNSVNDILRTHPFAVCRPTRVGHSVASARLGCRSRRRLVAAACFDRCSCSAPHALPPAGDARHVLDRRRRGSGTRSAARHCVQRVRGRAARLGRRVREKGDCAESARNGLCVQTRRGRAQGAV
jgi:hypothetical protein